MRSFRRLALFVFASLGLPTSCQFSQGPIGPGIAKPIPASVKIPVGAEQSAYVQTHQILITFTVPQAASGSGTLTIAASTTAPFEAIPSSPDVPTTVSPPGTPVCYVTLTTNGTATYDSFPTVSYDLASIPSTGTSFALNYTDPPDGVYLETIAGPVTASGAPPVVSFSATSFVTAIPSSTPILPLTLTAGNTYSFALYEVPSS